MNKITHVDEADIISINTSETNGNINSNIKMNRKIQQTKTKKIKPNPSGKNPYFPGMHRPDWSDLCRDASHMDFGTIYHNIIIINDTDINPASITEKHSSQYSSNKDLLHQASLQQYKLSNYQYFDQRAYESSSTNINPIFALYDANWPCIWSERLIGSEEGDGLKWGCGVHLLQEPCIIYSIGSMNKFSFEQGIYQMVPHHNCEIYTFDPSVKSQNLRIPPEIQHKVHFIPVGVSGCDHMYKNMLFQSIPSIMNRLNHSYIDILKIDVEGWEWPTFFAMEEELDGKWPSIGQIYIEIHMESDLNHPAEQDMFTFNGYSKQKNKTLADIINLFEMHGFRIFHKEVNVRAVGRGSCCSEYSFIQNKWHPDIKNYSMIDMNHPKIKLKNYDRWKIN